MIRLCTFHLPNMSISAGKLVESAHKHGFDEVKVYTENDIDPFFKKFMRAEIAETVKGGWFYIWKPAIILDAILNCDEGDVLGYIDAGTTLTDSVLPCIESMEQEIMLFSNGWRHVHWCKRETAEAINGSDAKRAEYYLHKQVQASAMFFKVNQKTIDFVREWYAWVIMPRMVDDISRIENYPEFQQHRYDQAILCCLQLKYCYHLHWFPAVMNQHQKTNEAYGTFLDHHRLRNEQW